MCRYMIYPYKHSKYTKVGFKNKECYPRTLPSANPAVIGYKKTPATTLPVL